MYEASAARLVGMTSMLEMYEKLRDARQITHRHRMADFLQQYEQEHARLQAQAPVSFNIFSILGMLSDEVRHSAFLAWLLDSRSGHKQGNLFFQSFLRTCGIPVGPANLDHYEVITEHSGLESVVDIAVWTRGRLLVYIENKILAREGQDQLGRESRDMRRTGAILGVPTGRQFAVFLTPRGQKTASRDSSIWISVSYPLIAQGFSNVLDRAGSDKVRHVVADWIATALAIGGEL